MKQLLLIILSLNLFSQKVVINEIQSTSGGNPSRDREWVELIVLDDMVDMRGYTLRDHGGINDGWRDGVTFRDDDLWNNLRQGTIIIIEFRRFADNKVNPDVNNEDGFIKVAADNSLYFINNDGGGGSLIQQNLNLNNNYDMIQLLNSSGSTEHLNGFFPANTGGGLRSTFDAISNNRKIAADGRAATRSVQLNGGSKELFTGGFYSNNPERIAIEPGSSEGQPNSAENIQYIRDLRHPEWNTPTLNANLDNETIRFSWNSAETDHDDTQGYMLVQYNSTNLTSIDDLPEDSKIYLAGDEIGEFGTVLDVFDSNTQSFEIQVGSLDCVFDYTFRVYAYRFNKDDRDEDSRKETARGRSYNESEFAFTTYTFDKPETPSVLSNPESEFICQNSTLELSSSVEAPTYRWYLNNRLIDGANQRTYTATTEGEYAVAVISENGCEVPSAIFDLQESPNPNALIFNKETDVLIPKDTTFIICENEEIILEASGGESFVWFKDDASIGVTTRELNISEEGSYYVQVTNGEICQDQSISVTVAITDFDVTVNDDQGNNLNGGSLDFGLTEFVSEKSIFITNNFRNQLVLFEDNFILPNFYTLVTPLPITIQSGQTEEIIIRFEPTDPGDYSEAFIISGPCLKGRRFDVTGNKPVKTVSVSRSSIPFGRFLECEKDNIEIETFLVQRQDSGIKKIADYSFDDQNSPFSVISPARGTVIDNDDEYEFQIQFDPLTDGIFSDILTIDIADDNDVVIEEVKILVEGEYREITYELLDENNNPLSLDFGDISSCVGSISGLFRIRNTSQIPIDLDVTPTNGFDFNLDVDNIIDPSDSYEVEYTYTPSQNADSGFLTITSGICQKELQIPYSSNLTGIVFTSDSYQIDFGEIYSCNLGQNGSKQGFNLIVSGDDIPASINSIQTNNLTVNNINENQQLSVGDNIEVEITINDGQIGLIEEELIIDFNPCGSRTYTITAEVQNLNIDITDRNTDLGVVPINSLSSTFIEITNNNHTDLNLIDIQGNNDFILATNIPILIIPGNTERVDFEITPNIAESSYQESIDLVFDQPCTDYIETINLEAISGVDPVKDVVTISVPDDLEADIENLNSFEIPIYIESDDITETEFGLERIRIQLEFNTKLIRLIQNEANPGVDNPSARIQTPARLNGDDSKWYISIVLQEELNYGEIASLRAYSAIADDYETDISVFYDEEIYSAENVDVLGKDGFFTLLPNCIRNYYIANTFNFKDTGEDGRIVRSLNEIEIDPIQEMSCKVKLISNLGREFQVANIANPKGSFFLTDEQKIKSGYYLLLIERGPFIEVSKIILAR